MLEDRSPNQQIEAIVPTSDDEDLFFLSQSSDTHHSGSNRTRNRQQGDQDTDHDGEDDKDDELTLPVRPLPLILLQNAQNLNAQQGGPGPEQATTPIPESTVDTIQALQARASTSNLGTAAASSPRSVPEPAIHPMQLSIASAPPSNSPTLPPPSSKDTAELTAPTAPSTRNIDTRLEQTTSPALSRPIAEVASIEDVYDTVMQAAWQDRSPSPAQSSDVTLPLVPSASTSRQPTPDVTPSFAAHPVLAGRNEADSEQEKIHEEQLEGQTQQLSKDKGLISSTPPLSPLRMPSRAPMPRSSPIQSQFLRTVCSKSDGMRGSADGVVDEPAAPRRDESRVSLIPPIPPLRMPGRPAAPQSPPRTRPPQASTSRLPNTATALLTDEQIARAAAAQPPTPPRRQLRARNAAQLNPYTLEAMRYQRALIRNDWQDAVVSQREWHRQERKRLAEEAARAERERTGAQGSEETQSQWLVPSSDPSSQADPDHVSIPSSPAASRAPEIPVDIPAIAASETMHSPATSSRSSSKADQPLPELSEMLAASSRNPSLRSSRDRAGPSKHATYKAPRSAIRVGPAAPSRQQQSNTEDSQQKDDDIPPPPPHVRRKHPFLAASPSDIEDANDPVSTNRDALIVGSSEDERSAQVTPIQKPRRRSRWSGDGSSSDSTDYERRFRQLKKMMPAGMARKHIRDLRAMRHGKAYHSDGHLSSSSSDAENSDRALRNESTRAQRDGIVTVSGDEELQPGQTRKRLRRRDSLDDNNALLLYPDSDSSLSGASSLSSEASVSLTHSTHLASHADDAGRNGYDEADEADEAPAAWWSISRLNSYVPYRERDAIDRMLSRTAGHKFSSKASVRKAAGLSQHRQARLDGFVSTHRYHERQAPSYRSHLPEIDQNQQRTKPITVDVTNQNRQQQTQKRKKKQKKRKLDPRVGRTTSSNVRGSHSALRNPPVVRPLAKPRLDLEQHDFLFAANPVKSWHHRPKMGVADELDGDSLSEGDEQWQVLGSVIMDSTPVALPDVRLAVRRSRAGALAPQTPSLASAGVVASFPAPHQQASPSVSLISGSVGRLQAVSDRSPDIPTRARPAAAVNTVQARSHLHIVSSTATDTSSGEFWDDFEGISLDFGIVPLDNSRRLNVAHSSLMSRLPDLVALPDRLLHRQHVPRTWSGDVLRLEDTVLTADMDHDDLATQLPFFMDNLRLKIGRSLDEVEGGVDARRHSKNLVADTGAFLGCWFVRQADSVTEGSTDPAAIFRSYRMMLERVEQLQASVLSFQNSTHASQASREDQKLICLQLAWMRCELCWRAIAICDADADSALEPDAPTVESLLAFSRACMSLLLHHGLHKCIHNLRKAAASAQPISFLPEDAMDVDQEEGSFVTVDEATSIWIGVIHLLDSFEKSRGVMEGRLFWTQFEAAYYRWDKSMSKRAALLRAESLWYCLFSISVLSQVSPAGQAQSAPLLRESWPLVAKALSFVKFRTDESNEIAMGWHMLAKRDAYVRVVLQRCCLLTSEWLWAMDGAEVTLARLFDIFNSHKLADLPTETGHDFPAFLRDFDVDKLSTAGVADEAAMQDPSFHLFVRLLSQAGVGLQKSATEAKEGDRRISRLFSRMTPVRVMPFTQSDVPTSSQRSVLFNHYTVVMLFLHLVPTSSPQRLRQIQSFLPTFKDADFLSQVTCIRAMMYVAVIFRHHNLDVAPVTKWFGETITVLRREYEGIESATKQFERQQLQQSLHHRNGPQPLQAHSLRMASTFENAPARQAALRRKEELARLLVVALRSIQHVIRHDHLHGGRRDIEEKLPDQLLMSQAWTQQMLEAQISLEPRIGQEVLKCIQTFLLARMAVMRPAPYPQTKSVDASSEAQAPRQQQQTRDEESQDSFAELFEADDDFDFDDPLLSRLLDGADTTTKTADNAQDRDKRRVTEGACATKKKWDRRFGDHVKTVISPSLFQLLSNIYHPDRRIEAAATGSVVMSLGVTERLNDYQPLVSGQSSSTSRSRMDCLLKAAEARQYVELVVDCWAGCAQVLVTNGLREWSSYLGFGNESWKRIDDPIGRRDVALRFLQNVISLDPTAVQRKEYEVEFLAVWIQTAVARVLSVQDVYTKSLIDAASDGKNQDSLLVSLCSAWNTILTRSTCQPIDETDDSRMHRSQTRWNIEGFTLDLDVFAQCRRALLITTYSSLASAVVRGTAGVGTAYSILSALLSSLRAYVVDTPAPSSSTTIYTTTTHVDTGRKSRNSLQEYLFFCKTTLTDLHTHFLGETADKINSLKAEYDAILRVVSSRLEEAC
ncbi:uncharacterized protein MEPE_00835 [Melanopsichium pennsylvanicum]|uniref:Methyl methanesulfonate-sensitivity protein 22 n=2 Tax=Melanopsichium pennsylvanicum TaxID=63383 RepID=A0AAJ4XGT0_9BASI|nr:conserved hypothetical protein [Melanopsichium pennsylvanicum 4]SNX82129.1 uncharacterized protein MEPE_00835 [Melanopsichium pennsylvanicum]